MLLAGVLVLGGAGCTDPRDRFDEFGDRLVDADTRDVDGAIVSELPALGGEWFVRARPDLAEDRFFNFRGTIVFTPVTANTGRLTLVLQPLDHETLEPVGEPIDGEEVDVNADGTFDWPMVGVIPARCNSISGTNANIDAVVHGTAMTDDFHCGGLTGTAGVLDLEGMTYGAPRIDDDDDELPAPVHACP
jgi:hypothetical protein